MDTHDKSHHQLEAGVADVAYDKNCASESPPAKSLIEDPYVTTDTSIVDWDSPNDVTNPMNWSPSKKKAHVLIVSLFTLTA